MIPTYLSFKLLTSVLERDLKYARWKMAIARSLDWIDDHDDDTEGKVLYTL